MSPSVSRRRTRTGTRPAVCALSAAVLVSLAAFAIAQPAPVSQAGVAHPERWPEVTPPLPRDAELEQRIAALIAKMSVEEKVGQIVQADISTVTPDDVRRYRLGSILAGGNSDPNGDFRSPPEAWLALADAFHAASMDTSGGHNAIPVLFGVDAVHGHNNIVGATLFPHNIGLGATRNPGLVGRIAAATAAEVRATGPEWTFAPTLAVPRDDRWGRTYEGYSEDPALVARYAGAVVEGLQGKVGTPGFLDGARVLATAKHFLADGATEEGRDQGDATIGEDELRDIHGAGYAPALAAGAQTVMASFSSWQGQKIHGNRSLLTGVLKERMGFDGFIVGDWNAHGQIPGCTNESCPAAINAGLDMFMAPDSWRGLYDNTLKQVRSGEIPMARLDDAVARILRVKMRLGLFEAGAPSARALGGKFDRIGSPEHRALARQAVRESLVLLKNENGVLPIDPRRRIGVAGGGADNVAQQAGGWTLTWQGTGVTPADFPNAQSIWDGLREQVEAAGGQAELAVDGRFTQKPDVAVVVFGEEPYAEFQGDLRTLAYRAGREDDLNLLKSLRAQGIPTIAVFLSGRPLWVNREINASDAFVAAWLPGSEGGGVADVLLRGRDGKVQHDFTGTLPYSWPKTAVQTVNIGDAEYAPLFPYGYGLSYAKGGRVGLPSEDPGVDLSQSQAASFLARGALAKGWQARVTGADGKARQAAGVPFASGDGKVTVRAVDRNAQEDAWQLQWTGPGAIDFIADAPVDLGRETNGDVLLLVTMRIDRSGTGLALRMGEAEGAMATVPLAGLPQGQWLRLGVPLKCFRAGNADMGKLAVPFGVQAEAGTRITLHEVSTGTDAERVVDCPRS
jgi:beta-glucosidase